MTANRFETLKRLVNDNSVSWHETVARAYDAGLASVQVEANALIDELKSKATGLADASGFNVTYDVPAGILHKLLAWRDGAAFAASIQAAAQQQIEQLAGDVRACVADYNDAKKRAEAAEKQLTEARAAAADAQMLAHRWMKRHDGVLAGKTNLPYPEPADLPKALAEARAQAFREAAEIARNFKPMNVLETMDALYVRERIAAASIGEKIAAALERAAGEGK